MENEQKAAAAISGFLRFSFFVLLMTIGLAYTFYCGFFMTKVTLLHHASDPHSGLAHLFDNDTIINIALHNKSNTPQHYKKVIIFLIDALRYDFAAYNFNTTSKYIYSTLYIEENWTYYENKMTIFKELREKYPLGSHLFRFTADAPTTTSQRLKAIATGSLSVFIEISKNLGSLEVFEDSFIHQFSDNKKDIVFMGDGTWITLHGYKNYLRSYDHDPFNVLDLDTIDNAVQEHIYSELNNTDYSLLIAHCVGLDHVGHALYANHSLSQLKLTLYNDIIKNITQLMDNETILLVFGDHGMTNMGDHGGATYLETASALFAFTKSGFSFPSSITDSTSNTPKYHLLARLKERIKEFGVLDELARDLKDSNTGFLPFSEEREQVFQIDLVATLCLLMKIPIPHNNLGVFIPELLNYPDAHLLTDLFYKVTLDYYINAAQIIHFVEDYYDSTHKISDAYVQDLKSRFYKFKDNLLVLINNYGLAKGIEEDIMEGEWEERKVGIYMEYMGDCVYIQLELYNLMLDNANYFREIWITYDLVQTWASSLSFMLLTLTYIFALFYIWMSVFPSNSISLLFGNLTPLTNSAFLLHLFIYILSAYFDLLYLIIIYSLVIIIYLLFTLLRIIWKHKIFIARFSTSNIPLLTFIIMFIFGVLRIYALTSQCLIEAEEYLLLQKQKLLTYKKLLIGFGIIIISRIINLFTLNENSQEQVEEISPIIKVYLPFISIKLIMYIYSTKQEKETQTRRNCIWFMHKFLSIISDIIYIIYGYFLYENMLETEEYPRIKYDIPLAIYSLSILTIILQRYMSREICISEKIISTNFVYIFMSIINSYYLISRSQSPLILNIWIFLIPLFIHLQAKKDLWNSMLGIMFWYFSALSLFYCTGHAMKISKLQLEKGYVGQKDYNLYFTGITIAANVFSPFILAIISLFVYVPYSIQHTIKEENYRLFGALMFVVGGGVFMFHIQALVTFLENAVNKSQLHLVEVYAPKLFFDTTICVCVQITAILSFIYIYAYVTRTPTKIK